MRRQPPETRDVDLGPGIPRVDLEPMDLPAAGRAAGYYLLVMPDTQARSDHSEAMRRFGALARELVLVDGGER